MAQVSVVVVCGVCLTTHSMQEIETLCKRVASMGNKPEHASDLDSLLWCCLLIDSAIWQVLDKPVRTVRS